MADYVDDHRHPVMPGGWVSGWSHLSADSGRELILGDLRPRADRSSVWVPLRRVRPDRRFPLRTIVGDLGVLVASIRARGWCSRSWSKPTATAS